MKTLCNWMDFLVVPIVLALGTFILNHSEKSIEVCAELEREFATDCQHEVVLQTYLDRMSGLLLNLVYGKSTNYIQ
jgi:hypothetical protein